MSDYITFSPAFLNPLEASATADTTTTSATDALMAGMTLTPIAGSYQVIFSSNVDHSAQNVAILTSIYVGGILKADSVRSIFPRPNALGANSLSMTVATNGLVTVNGAQAIEIKWKTASGTATAHQRTLNIIKVL